MKDKVEILESCIKKSFGIEGEIDFDKSMEEYGVNSISFIKMLVLLEKELGIEFDEDTFKFSDYNTPNQILKYIESLEK